MRKISTAIAIIVVFGLFLVTDSYAQQGMKWRGSKRENEK